MAAHRKAERGGSERLGLLLDRPARAPPPGAMDEGPVRRVHEPDHRVIYGGGEDHALDEIGQPPVFKAFKKRDLGGRGRLVAKEYPDVALHLARRVGAGMNT